MTSPFAALALSILQATLVVVATMIMRACVTRRFTASRAAVCAVGMVSILLVTALTFFPLPNVWPVSEPQMTGSQSADEVENRLADVARDGSLESLPTDSTHTARGGIALPWALLRQMGEGLQQATAAADSAPRSWQDILIALLSCGIGIAVIRLGVAIRAVRKLDRKSIVITDRHVTGMVANLALRCEFRKAIQVCETAELPTAATFGWLRPVILLPTGWRTWSQEELAAVLAHEVAHIVRGDYLRRLISQLSAAVHFYHPLVKALAKQLAADQEFAADRLARSMQQDERAYIRGLARLALRYDDSLQGGVAWSSVSIMPQSSDFLARRLEMLRTKDGLAGKRSGTLISWCASAGVLAVAFAATLLRAEAESSGSADKDPVRVATLPAQEIAAKRKAEPDGGTKGEALFARETFDVSMLSSAEHGAFVIRVADMLRNAELQPRIEEWNQSITEGLRSWTENKHALVDLRDIEWIAGSMELTFKGPDKNRDMAQMMLASGITMIRMSRANDWQAAILKCVPGSSIKTHQGQSYVELPVIPAVGPPAPCLRIVDDRTIVVCNGFRRDREAADVKQSAKTALDRMFAKHAPGENQYAWAEAWKAVDGGLITMVCDFSKSGWVNLPEDKKEIPEFILPLVEKAQFFAVGGDWTDGGTRAGIRTRVTCKERADVKDMHLAASVLLNCWPQMLLENPESFEEHHERFLQLFSSVKIRPSAADSNQHFVHVEAAVPVKNGELIKTLALIFAQPNE